MALSKNKMYVEDNDIIELMLANKQAKILPRNVSNYEKFETFCKSYNLDVPFKLDKDSDDITWNTADEFKDLDLRKFILSNHKLDSKQIERVEFELNEFEKRNLLELLKFLVYFVKVLRDNNIIYGVGRGSSIASYVLYLIGIHRIDSLKYNLDIKEFLK